ncbi:MAG: hypothetical protein C0507_09855 [Cyanobacteria bacterium PR.3.49]|nr:hypothetical protein [Cyanobacteria bacterium PR.3.49]
MIIDLHSFGGTYTNYRASRRLYISFARVFLIGCWKPLWFNRIAIFAALGHPFELCLFEDMPAG